MFWLLGLSIAKLPGPVEVVSIKLVVPFWRGFYTWLNWRL